MNKSVVCLVVVLLASPTWAAVTITCTPGPETCQVTIGYINGELDPVRGFGLDIDTGEANVVAVECVNADYYVHPGSIEIDASGTVTAWGTCVCSGYAGTQSGLDDPNVTIEMVSNYVGEANEPCSTGTLAIITVEVGCTVQVSENTILGGVVMEDPNADPCVPPVPPVVVCGDLNNCQMASLCPGQGNGDATCDGSINLADLFALKQHFGKAPPWVGNACCADFTGDDD
ncbi:MAG: hypothetical protein ACYTEX_23025 [Planctomycetota bacterium]|jgi:hypothetical protein